MIGGPQRGYYHTIAWRKVGTGVRIVGALDGEVSLSCGISPAILQLRVPKHEYDRLGGDFTGVGDLEFYFKRHPNDGVPDFVWRTWNVWQVEETRRGWLRSGADGQSGQLGPFGVVERRFTFIDARRVLRPGYGGLLTVGLWNKPREDGKSNLREDGRMEFSLYRGIKECLVAMGLQNDFDDATQSPADHSLMAKVPVALKDVDAPRNLDWSGAHAPSELAKLLELANMVVAPSGAGGIDLYMIDATRPVTIPASVSDADVGGHELPFEEAILPEDRPTTVIVTSAPTYIVNQLTVTGPSPAKLDFVGFDFGLTEEIKVVPLATLSFLGGGGYNAILNLLRYGLWSGEDGARKAVTDQAFRYLQVYPPQGQDPNPNAKRLPILKRIAETLGGVTTRPDSLYVQLTAKCRIQTGKGWENATGDVSVPVRIHNAEAGILELYEPLGKLVASPCEDPMLNFTPLQDGDLFLTFAFEKKEGVNPQDRYYVAGFRAQDGGAANDPVIADRLLYSQIDGAMNDPETFVVSAPELRLLQSEGGDLNRPDLDRAARKIAESLLSRGRRQGTIRRFRGFHNFHPDGQIARVAIQQSPPTTTIEVNTHFVAASRLADESMLRPLKKAASDATRQAARPEAARTGTQEHAGVSPIVQRQVPQVEPFVAEITGHTGSAAPFTYQAKDLRPDGSDGDRESITLKNDAEDPKRLNPTNLPPENTPTWLAIPNTVRVRVQWDPLQNSLTFDAPPQPDRGPCDEEEA